MRGTIDKTANRRRSSARGGLVVILCALVVVCCAVPAAAWKDTVDDPVSEMGYNPSGAFILDGSFVMNVGEVQINITNWGLIGSRFSNPSSYSDAPSCQWPAGSGNEYLWQSSLWVGGVVLGERLCSTGSEFLPVDELEATIYEAIGGRLTRPPGNLIASGRRRPTPKPDDDDDGFEDEEILNGKNDDPDNDLLIDEDFGQIGNQMFVLTNYDNTRLAMETFPDHKPMNLEVVQQTYQWENDETDDFVGFEYTITNVGVTDVERVYIGFFSDSDIGSREGDSIAEDDMAGSFRGLVQATDGSYIPVEVGYMYDGAETGRLDGYFGIVFLGHDVDPTGRRAPPRLGLRTFQSFAGNRAFEQGGDPTNDDERYQLLSAPPEEWDPNTMPGKQDDFRFMVSVGPFVLLGPDETLQFQVAMVVGPGLGNVRGGPGLLRNCAAAYQTWNGIWVDDIGMVASTDGPLIETGVLGRETMICQGRLTDADWADLLEMWRPDFMDVSCIDDASWLLAQDKITTAETFPYEGETCAMFNMDNCFECARQLGYYCGTYEFEAGMWDCNRPNSKPGCTGVNGLDTQINWLVGMAPPPPGLRLWSTDSEVHVFWDNLSAMTKDIRLQQIDFESYRVWRADNWDRPFGSSLENGPESSLWQMIAEFDTVNIFVNIRDNPGGADILDTIPLGANTGFSTVHYVPVALDDEDNVGLAEAMQEVVDSDSTGQYSELPYLYDIDGEMLPQFEVLKDWAYYPNDPAVLDTFFAMTARAEAEGVKEKVANQYYHYVDRDIHNGFIYFYSVTATDHAMLAAGNVNNIDTLTAVGPGLGGDPGSSFSNTTPGAVSQSAEERARDGANIYVYPNPATRDALAEYQELKPSGDDPVGVRVTFTNLPAAVNTIKIYTASGDLVVALNHDGTSGVGHISWNLMSRNGQEIVSGIYLYAVESNSSAFDTFVGKFVVVR